MSRFLCVLELGEDLGHLGRFSPLIAEFLARGHEVFFAAHDLARASTFPWFKQVAAVRAPVWLSGPIVRPPAYCFADILYYKGFHSSDALRPQVVEWQKLFQSVKPDVIIFDHAPTALLASNSLGIPRVIFGNGFTTPPPGTLPMCLRHGETVEDDRMEKMDDKVVGVINMIAREQNLNLINSVSDLYRVESVFIAGLADFDFYRDLRKDAAYIGPLPPPNHEVIPCWQPASTPKVFAYLKYGQAQVISVLDGLISLNTNLVCYCAGMPQHLLQDYQAQGIEIRTTPFDLQAVMTHADAVVCHGGRGMIDTCIHYGRRMILLPTQLEQTNSSIRLVQLGAAMMIEKSDDATTVSEKLHQFLASQSYWDGVRKLADKSCEIQNLKPVATICDACETLIKSAVKSIQ